MFSLIMRKIFGTKNERVLQKLQPTVDYINSFEPDISSLTNDDLKNKTALFKKRYQDGETLDMLLPEAFAVVREVAKRTLDMRHFDVQLMGGIVLHQGKIAEMVTGEGKTLVSTLPVYLHSIAGIKTHVVTVNDYLARRDALWMSPIYKFLELEVGLVQNDTDTAARQLNYNCDVVYVTNNELGFDYLRDNMAHTKHEKVLGKLQYAIIDEVDSILIDEARTPLIISGPSEESSDKYSKINKIIPFLKGRDISEREETVAKHEGVDLEKGYDYLSDEKNKNCTLTEQGVKKCENLLGIENLYDALQSELLHHINQALRAHKHFRKDVDYVIKDGQILIVDEFTGRLMPGRRWSDGLHQAIEAKESLTIASENQTLATITFQNFFRIYEMLAGMTGTAITEEEEFHKIYGLDVIVIPTNKPLVRNNLSDVIYRTEREKYDAILNEVQKCYNSGRPVLLGTRSIESNEKLSNLLKKRGVRHNLLNAKYHEHEADIIAQAGGLKAITVATNMAGRGTDILLGGNPSYLAKEEMRSRGYDAWLINQASELTSTDDTEILKARDEYNTILKSTKELIKKEHDEVIQLGGLYIIGTERHESRRIDNQLRGRSGRQGDPGSSRFYLSLEDELMRLFGSDRMAPIMDRLGLEEGQEIEHPLISRAIESAQKKVESMNFNIRKQLIEYDTVMNEHRKAIYAWRSEILNGENIKDSMFEMIEDIIDDILDMYAPEKVYPEQWDLEAIQEWMRRAFNSTLNIQNQEIHSLNRDRLGQIIASSIKDAYDTHEKEIGSDMMRHIERIVRLQVIDNCWKDHLKNIDDVRKGIGLRAYGNKDPIIEYKRELFEMFNAMVKRIKQEVAEYILKIRLTAAPASASRQRPVRSAVSSRPTPDISSKPKKISRNDPCLCGSGKKYKKCCGK